MSTRPNTYAALFLVSFGVFMAEVALTRFFSFSLWYHFAYMTISVALLGYGAAGSVYFAFPTLTAKGMDRALALWAGVSALSFAACLVIVSNVPFDPASLFGRGRFDPGADPLQFLYLAIFYLAVTAPFLAAGLCVTMVLSNAPARIPQLYFADLAGGAFGCVGSVSLLTPLGAPGVIALGTTLVAVSGVLFAWPDARLRRRAIGVAVPFALCLVALSQGFDAKPAPTKNIARMEAGGAQRIFTRWNPVYRVDVLSGREGKPLRGAYLAAWGVSDRYQGPVPENLHITHDGSASTMMYQFDGDWSDLEFLDHSVLRLPYLLLDEPEVFVIGVGGGVDILTALKNEAGHVTGIELNPVTVELLTTRFEDYNGRIFKHPDVTLRVDEGRNAIRRSDRRFDLIQITGVDTVAATYSGAYVLSESYVYTVEAMREYLAHLRPGGVFTMVRGDWLFKNEPPTQILRLLSIMIEALRQEGVEDPSRHLLVTMSEGHGAKIPIFSLMMRPTPFGEDEVARVEAHIEAEAFQAWHLPGQRLDTVVGRFVHLDPPARADFLARDRIDYSPTRDDRPFFFNFFKWSTLLREGNPRSDYTAAAGQLVLLAILVQALVFGVLLIVGPLLRRGLARSLREVDDRYRFLLYFGCLGVGFIFIEISYIQRFTLFLGSPVYSLSVILASLLFFTGTGSFLSARLGVLAENRPALLRLAVALCVLNGVYVLGLPAIFGFFLGNSLPLRIGVAVLLLAPAGLVMGAFFPIGMRVVTGAAPQMIPWAWAANGITSVFGSILCIVLAISVGFKAVNLIALGVYLVGVAALLRPAARATR